MALPNLTHAILVIPIALPKLSYNELPQQNAAELINPVV